MPTLRQRTIEIAPTKCVACGRAHSASECKRPKDVPATCVNCGGIHPANYKRCSRCPNVRSVPVRAFTPKKQERNFESGYVVPGVNYSQAVTFVRETRGPDQGRPPPREQDFPPLTRASRNTTTKETYRVFPRATFSKYYIPSKNCLAGWTGLLVQ